MQFLFNTEEKPETYTKGKGTYPDAPEKCPHKGCHAPVKMKKHGYYKRYIIIWDYIGEICVRRYICPICGKTISMLPSFCVPQMQYGLEVIIMALLIAARHNSVRYTGTKWPKRPETLRRRHIIYYRTRLKRNRGSIQLILNLMSPEFMELSQITGDTDWTRKFLEAAKQTNPLQFNADYHKLAGKSFMSLHNKVA